MEAAAAPHFELRKLAVHGAVSGLFFAQTVSWQHLIEVVIESVFGVASTNPWFAFWRALLVTAFTSCLAWVIVTAARVCTASAPGVEIRTA